MINAKNVRSRMFIRQADEPLPASARAQESSPSAPRRQFAQVVFNEVSNGGRAIFVRADITENLLQEMALVATFSAYRQMIRIVASRLGGSRTTAGSLPEN
jgi:hypothetical protein